MKKIIKILSISMLSLLFVGCAAKQGIDYEPHESNAGANHYDTDYNNNVVIDTNRKVAYTVDYSISSDDMNNIKLDINNKCYTLNGHISYSSESQYYANVTYRVPTNNLNTFLDYVDNKEGVATKTINTTDITSEYSYTEARIETLEASRAAYVNLLSNTNLTRDEIIKIQDKIDTIDTELTQIRNTLARYDDLVNYSTINIKYRVVNYSTYEEPGFFSEYFEYLGNFFVGLFTVIMYSLPFLALGFGIFSAIFFPIRAKKRKLNK